MKNTKHEIAKEIADNIIGSLEYQCGAQEGALLALEKIEELPRKVDLLTIMTKFGAFHQLKKLSEEVFEFQEATLRFLHKGVQKAAITEEMADVLVVLSQFRELFGHREVWVRELRPRSTGMKHKRTSNTTQGVKGAAWRNYIPVEYRKCKRCGKKLSCAQRIKM